MKLSEAVDLYLAQSGNLRTATSRKHLRSTAQQLASFCGDRAIGSYTTDELTAFCLGAGGRGTAPNSILNRMSTLRPLFDWCAWQKIIARNPTTALKYTVKVRRQGVREHTWLTEHEVADIARSFDTSDLMQHRDLVIFRTIVMLGLRRAEAVGLDWPSFRRQFAEVSLVGKGSKRATLPLPAALQAELRRWRDVAPDGGVLFPCFVPTPEYLPTGRTTVLKPAWHRPLAGDGLYAVVKKIARRHGVALAPHDLRRTFAGILDSKGVPLRDLQKLMRHEQLATTDRYLENNPGRLAAIVEGIEWGA